MVRSRDPSELGTWLQVGTDSGIAFAQGVWSDLEAVREGMRQAWSNGRVEGHVNKLKLVDRQMYGRAKFGLLRASPAGRPGVGIAPRWRQNHRYGAVDKAKEIPARGGEQDEAKRFQGVAKF